MTMPVFAGQLRGMTGTYLVDPVIDATGLPGSWDFDLHWNRRYLPTPAGTERITVFEAIEKELGLGLVPHAVPAPVLVVDSVNEQPTANLPNVAQLFPPGPTAFEVASFKLNRSGQTESWRFLPGGLEVKENLREILATSFDIHWDHIDEMIVGAPKWMDSTPYEIVGKTAAASGSLAKGTAFSDDETRLMLRNLLIERLKMKFHYEDRRVNAYTLVSAKLKLRKANPANRATCRESRTIPNDPMDQNPRLSRLIACHNVTMAQFAAQLQGLATNDFTYPVEDATHLSGAWDFTLSFTPSYALQHPDAPTGDGLSDPSGGLSISDAMSKQLGVKLELRKRTLPVLVIDQIQLTPTEN